MPFRKEPVAIQLALSRHLVLEYSYITAPLSARNRDGRIGDGKFSMKTTRHLYWDTAPLGIQLPLFASNSVIRDRAARIILAVATAFSQGTLERRVVFETRSLVEESVRTRKETTKKH